LDRVLKDFIKEIAIDPDRRELIIVRIETLRFRQIVIKFDDLRYTFGELVKGGWLKSTPFIIYSGKKECVRIIPRSVAWSTEIIEEIVRHLESAQAK